MLSRMQRLMRKMRRDEGGNATLLMAIGMPVLLGSSGLAVDFSQWYMWKRELQYAVDQSAIAGAWAKADVLSAADYNSRAGQEFTANLSQLKTTASTPVISLVDYGGGTQNSVVVSATASDTLPFTQVVIGRAVTVAVSAQATFEAATNYTTCLLAVDPSASPGFVLGGTASGDVTCGAGTLATSPTAMKKNGNPSAQLGYLVAGGGIDSGFTSNGAVNANVSNLSDPYASLKPPSDSTPRIYSCPTSTTTTSSSSKTADITTTTSTTYTYWQGKNQNQANTQVTYSGAGAKSNTSVTTTSTGQSVPSGTTEGQVDPVTTTFDNWTGSSWSVSGSKNQKIFEYKKGTKQNSYSNVASSGSGTTTTTSATYTVSPGTYNGITIACDTNFLPGIYSINGTLDFGSGYTVNGTDIMFVISGSGNEKMKLNAGSTVNLSGITKSTLKSQYSVSNDDASDLAGMLIHDATSTANMKFNGHASATLNGIVYMPKRNGKFNGNATNAGSCMILALATLTFTGTNDLGSFCHSNGSTGIDIGGTTVQVRLVA